MPNLKDLVTTESEAMLEQNKLASTERIDAVTAGIVGTSDKSGSALKDPLFSKADNVQNEFPVEEKRQKSPIILSDGGNDNDEFGDELAKGTEHQISRYSQLAVRKLKGKNMEVDKPTVFTTDEESDTNGQNTKNPVSKYGSNVGLGKLTEKNYLTKKSAQDIQRTEQARHNQYVSRNINSSKTGFLRFGNTADTKRKARSGEATGLISKGGTGGLSAFALAIMITIFFMVALIFLTSLAGDDDADVEELTGAEKIVAEYLLAKGLDPLHVAAIMGNIEAESEFNSALIEKGTGIGHGLCQWGGDGVRLEGLYAYTKSKGKDWTDIYCQLDYLWAEMTGKGDAKDFAQLQSFSYKHSEFIAITDLEDAVYYFGRKFERPNEAYAHWNRRIESAWKFFYLIGGSSNIVDEAKKHLGKPYVWGATGADAFDCSGLVYYVYNQCGIKIPRLTAQGYYAKSEHISKKEAVPGDLLFFGTPMNVHHIGIYIGNGKMIHAPKPGDVVKIAAYNWSDFLGYGRIKK